MYSLYLLFIYMHILLWFYTCCCCDCSMQYSRSRSSSCRSVIRSVENYYGMLSSSFFTFFCFNCKGVKSRCFRWLLEETTDSSKPYVLRKKTDCSSFRWSVLLRRLEHFFTTGGYGFLHVVSDRKQTASASVVCCDRRLLGATDSTLCYRGTAHLSRSGLCCDTIEWSWQTPTSWQLLIPLKMTNNSPCWSSVSSWVLWTLDIKQVNIWIYHLIHTLVVFLIENP